MALQRSKREKYFRLCGERKVGHYTAKATPQKAARKVFLLHTRQHHRIKSLTTRVRAILLLLFLFLALGFIVRLPP